MTLKISMEMMKRGSKVELSSLKKDEGSMPVDKKEGDEEERRTKWKLISMEIWWPRGRRSKRLQECRVGERRRKYFRSDESFLYIYSVTSNDNVIIVRSLRTRRISSGRERGRRHQKAIGAPFQHGSRVKKRKTERKRTIAKIKGRMRRRWHRVSPWSQKLISMESFKGALTKEEEEREREKLITLPWSQPKSRERGSERCYNGREKDQPKRYRGFRVFKGMKRQDGRCGWLGAIDEPPRKRLGWWVADYEGKREGGGARGRYFEGMPKGGRRWVLGRGQEVTRVRVRT